MHLRKQVLILTVLFTFVASMGAVAVSAQTSPMTAPDRSATSGGTAAFVNPLPISSSVSPVAAVFKQPTTFALSASNQSVNLTAKNQWVQGILRNGSKGLGNQTVVLWRKIGTGNWTKVNTTKTGTGLKAGVVSWYVNSSKAQTTQYQAKYAGTSVYAAATSNIVGIKFESTKTTPYLTYLVAYAPVPVAPHGSTAKDARFSARLMNGQKGLGNKKVTVWVSTNGTKWVLCYNTTTLNGTTNAGWVNATVENPTAGTTWWKLTFAGASPYAASESNAVQLIWT